MGACQTCDARRERFKMKIRNVLYAARLFVYSKTLWDGIIPGMIRPYAVTIKLTERCNSRCITCNYWRKKSEDRIDKDAAIDLMQQLAAVGVNRIRFSGGEPLLRDDFFDIIEKTRGLGFEKVTVASNGLLLRVFADRINDSCITDLGISIDGTRETNDRIRGVSGYFDRVMEGLELIKGKRITIMTTLNNKSHLELPELFKMCEDRGYLWDYNLPDNRSYFLRDTELDSITPEPEDAGRIFDVIKECMHMKCGQRLSPVQLDYAYKYLKGIVTKEPRCYMGFVEMFIDSGGNVLSGCHSLPPVGNIMKNTLKEILGTDVYQKRVRDMLGRKCHGCTCGYGVNEILENLHRYTFIRIFNRKGLLPS